MKVTKMVDPSWVSCPPRVHFLQVFWFPPIVHCGLSPSDCWDKPFHGSLVFTGHHGSCDLYLQTALWTSASFCLPSPVKCKYFQVLSQSVLQNCSQILCWDRGGERHRPPLAKVENVIYFPSAMVSKVKILLIGIDFASLFSFPSVFPSINIYTYILERRSKGSLPPCAPCCQQAHYIFIMYQLPGSL